MRVNRLALAISLCAGLAMFAGRAHAGGISSDLISGSFNIVSSQEPNTHTVCAVTADDSTFDVFGSAAGNDGTQAVVVSYDTPQPTSASRKTQTARIKQSTFSFLSFKFGAAAADHGDRRKVQRLRLGQHQESRTARSASSCKSDDVFGVLTANEASSVEAAFANSTTVKVKLNANKGKGSITIKCKGDLGPS